jgi:hypothetical protein
MKSSKWLFRVGCLLSLLLIHSVMLSIVIPFAKADLNVMVSLLSVML